MAYNVLQISEGKDLETKILILKQNIIMKTKTSIYYRTFAFAYVLLVAVIFCGCEDGNYKVEAKPTNTGGQVKTTNGIFVRKLDLDEFEYKGHIYVSCDVRDGIAMTHAGHCWCNGSKK